MVDQEITNLMLFFAGNQRLPTGIRVDDEPPDQTEQMVNAEIRIAEYVRGIPNFAKQLHDKAAARGIYDEILSILDVYDFDIKSSFKILWEIAIFGSLPVSGIPEGKTIESFAKDHLEILKSRILNNTLKTYITSEIRTPSKYKNIIKRIFNLNAKDFESMFNEVGLSNTEQTRRTIMDAADEKVCDALNAMVKFQEFDGVEDEIVSVFYNTVKVLYSHMLRNDYYNRMLLKLVKKMSEMKKVPNKLINILIQFYCFVTQHEVIKTIEPKVTTYVATIFGSIGWFSYQVREMSTKLQPHWNFKSKEFILDAWQKECLRHIENKDNILLSAPTSSGKTILSTYAINKYSKVLYIVPSEALAYQLTGIILASLMDKEKLVGSVKKNVHLELDSISYKRYDRVDDIIIATPQQMVRLIRQKVVSPSQDYIILDEFHNISYDMGNFYEYILKFGGFHKIPVICLSATIPNFAVVRDWLSTILHGPIFGVNEHKRFFNQKRMVVTPTSTGTRMSTIDPLKHMKFETLRSPDFSQIGLYPKEVLSLYEKLPGIPRIDESTPRFIKLDDVQELEVNIFSYLKSQPDSVLSEFVSDTPIDSQSLTVYQLYITLRDIDSRMKPMLVFKMDSTKCLEMFRKFVEVITDYNTLVYGDFNQDQAIIAEYFAEIDGIEKEAKGGKDESKEAVQDKIELKKQQMFEPYLFRLEEFARQYLRIKLDDAEPPQPQMLPDVIRFNEKYGANLTVESIHKLRSEHIATEKATWIFDYVKLRNGYAIHDNSRLMSSSISPEQMRKIRNQINRELEREVHINGEFPNMKQYGKEYDKFNTVGGVISYTHPIMLGIEYGLLCYNVMLNPALTRVCQQLINKFPFITISDKSLAVGINYPIKTVMLLGGLKGEPLEEIDNTLAHQAMGRAGRRGMDTEGIVIYTGVNITSILTPQYRSVVPNDPALMSSMFTDESEDFKTFVMTGVRPAPIISVPCPALLVAAPNVLETVVESEVDLEVPISGTIVVSEVEDWETLADAMNL